ncbi:MAG: hypothetical protein IT373_14440 [Polyangiaceae bacterium]|nr:hypothetical protein [Polyangiaceae bacterium]
MRTNGATGRGGWLRAGVLLGALGVGCGPAAPPAEPARGAAEPEVNDVPRGPAPCQAYCDRSDGCRREAGSEPDPGCPASCRTVPAPPIAGLRGDYLWGVARCLDLLDCAGIAQMAGAVGGCQTLARHDLPPSPAVRHFCAAATRRGARCGQDPDQGDCLERYRVFSDAVLARAGRCLELECPEVPACVERTLFGAP